MTRTITDKQPFRRYCLQGRTHFVYFIVCLILLGLPQLSAGQGSVLSLGDSSPSSASQLERMLGSMPSNDLTGETFFEGPVNPDEYTVGPGDRFTVYFWKPVYTEYSAVIGAEGELVLPLVGAVNVAEMTLREAKQAITDAVGLSMKNGSLTVTLVEPRKFRVHVTGQVNTPGTYVVPATARVSDAIVAANGLKRERDYSRGDTAWTVLASQRRIELRNSDGDKVGSADMRLFLSGGKLDANPYLSDGTTIYVPFPDHSKNMIGVFGEVNNSDLFEYAEGDRLLDAISLAGGLTALADRTSITIQSGGSGVSDEFNLDVASERERALLPGDRIYVYGQPEITTTGSVTLSGQIAAPGGYPIIPGVTTLDEVLAAAGGFTEDAAVNSARLVRKNLKDLAQNERTRISYSANTPNIQPVFPADLELAAEFARWDYGTVVIDLSGNGQPAPSEVVLHDGDHLEVPAEPLGVRVLGFVNHGGEVPWIEGGRLNDYLHVVDGLNPGGWKNRTVVIKASTGSQIRYGRQVTIDPGDLIFIPSKPKTTNWERFKDVVSVTAQLATLALVIQNVSK